MAFGFGLNFNPLAGKQMGIDDAAAKGAAATGSSVFGMLQPGIQNQLNPSATTVNALTQLPTEAANANFATAQQNATDRMARTNNSAGYAGMADKLAMDKAKAGSAAALQGQNAVLGLQNTGVKNASDVYGIAQKTMADLYGAGTDAAKAGGVGFKVGA